MDGATESHMKHLYRTIKFVLDTRNISLVMKPNLMKENKWTLEAFSDSDFGGDRDTRQSVTGYIVYLCGVPIIWKSKQQRSVTLSSTEAEYVAVSEVCTEISFAKQVLEFLGMKVELPITVYVDNKGAIFLANNATTGQRTKHIDIRHHYIREHVENGIVVIRFVRSDDNDADLMTKNTSQRLYKKHTEKYMEGAMVLSRGGVAGL
jgi:hypothetical protein